MSTKNDYYSLAISSLIGELENKLTPIHSSSSRSNPQFEASFSGFKRPKIQLPEFDGKPEEFSRFFKNFEEIMDRENCFNFARLSCLVQQLKGSAKTLIEKSPEADMDYDKAKKLLEEAFNNTTLQQFSVIEKLRNLKLNSDFYSWISDAKLIESQISSLKITSKVFIQYFLWNGLPKQYKTQYINITNNTFPNLDEILKHSFEVQNRMNQSGFVNANTNINPKTNSSQTISPVEKKTVALATNIEVTQKQNTKNETSTKGMVCFICKALEKSDCYEHALYNCPNFKNPESKLQKLKELNGCTKCGYTNHKAKECKFKFNKKCKHCEGSHNSFLCGKKQNGPTTQKTENKNTAHNKNKNNTQTETSTNLVELTVTPIENPSSEQVENSVLLNSLNVTSTQNITLPTFTTACTNKNNNNQDLRVLYDSASEMSFISQSVAQKLKCKVLQSNIILNIKGFNDNKYYKTHIIQIDVKIKNELNNIVAAVVPVIHTKANIPPPQVLKAFHENKISLADKHLGNIKNREIHILLGVSGAHILPVHACSFGTKNNMSLLYYTSLGIMLAGDINTLIKNIPHLNMVNVFIEHVNLLHETVKVKNKKE